MQLWALIVDGFRESRDHKIFWVMLAISLAVSGAMFCVGFQPGKVDVLFGMWEYETDHFTGPRGLRVDIIAGVAVDLILDLTLGWIGIVLAIIATGSFFPSFMVRGAIDVTLAKPISRGALFLGRYVGAMAFIFFHALVFVILTFLVIGVRWGAWLPGYLLTIPLIVLLFSYLYCISALVGVTFRSTVAAVLLTLGAWVGFAGIQELDNRLVESPEWQQNRLAYQSVRVARWAVPKTQDIVYVAKKWAGAANSAEILPEPDEPDRELIRAARVEAERMKIPAVQTIGSSLLFELVLVLLAMWKFARTDF